VNRRRGAVPRLSRGDIDDLAVQAADDALVAVLAKLDTYRGASRFTTWVYKFALYEAAVKVRRRGWQNREIPVEPESWPAVTDQRAGLEADVEAGELLGAIRDGVNRVLTPHQREVLVALAINGVPIDVLAERLNTTRGALYKTLHDARRKLRNELGEAGFDVAVGTGKSDD
jgi:RNA polymerase sigma-70 factor, ECF subfamily